MARSRSLEVRMERQPHRDAVYRLRQAYRCLRIRSPRTPTFESPQTEAETCPSRRVQEVPR